MRATLINPFDNTIEDIDIPNTKIETIYEQIGAGRFDIARLGSNVVAFVDDMGLYRKDQRFWFFDMQGGRKLMAGKALLLSTDFEGETIELDPRATLELTRAFVRFIGNGDAAEVAIVAGAVKRPETTINSKVTWQWSPSEQKL